MIGHTKAGPLNITGIEGSFYTRTSDGMYHFLSGGRMAAPEGMDIHMRFEHWQSADGVSNWTWTAKIYESSGASDGTDWRGSTWAPIAVFDKKVKVWHLGVQCIPSLLDSPRPVPRPRDEDTAGAARLHPV